MDRARVPRLSCDVSQLISTRERPPMPDTVQKILIAVFSVFLGLALGWARDLRDRARRRAALATAILFELHELEDSLQALVTDKGTWRRLHPRGG